MIKEIIKSISEFNPRMIYFALPFLKAKVWSVLRKKITKNKQLNGKKGIKIELKCFKWKVEGGGEWA